MENVADPSTQVKPQYKSGKEVMDAQYERGKRVIEKNPWAKEAFNQILERCPHVVEFDVVRLFDGKSQSHEEFIIGAALFKEYNALNPVSLPRAKRVIPVYRPPPKEVPQELPPRPALKAGRQPQPQVKVKAIVQKKAKATVKPARSAAKAKKAKAHARKAKAVRPRARPAKAKAPAKGAKKAKGKRR
ncbi:MAG: hypothetical protein HY556_08835 [Euryarchaeota archaeon]|nr:hypothetical protein [Euryarchaeota archaeon]